MVSQLQMLRKKRCKKTLRLHANPYKCTQQNKVLWAYKAEENFKVPVFPLTDLASFLSETWQSYYNFVMLTSDKLLAFISKKLKELI